MKIASLFIPVLDCRNANCTRECRKEQEGRRYLQMLHYYVASWKMVTDKSWQAFPKHWWGREQSGVQKLTNPLNC